MHGCQAKKTLVGMTSLANVAFSEEFYDTEEDKGLGAAIAVRWHQLMEHAVPMLTELSRLDDWTDRQIFRFHMRCNLFFVLYVDMFHGEGITNYIHLLGAGHITYYLFKYRNLARFQQQGWEALNKLVILFYHHNTNRGGSKGNRNGNMEKGDHCGPLMRLFQRRYMWLLGQLLNTSMLKLMMTATPSSSLKRLLTTSSLIKL